MSNIIKQIEQEQMKQDVPAFRPGDSVLPSNRQHYC